MLLIYDLFVRLYALMIRLAAIGNQKAKQWVEGRKGWQEKLKGQLPEGTRIIWFHCASAGEFEQAKPLIEELKNDYPGHKVLVSFFSPSGYQTGQKYPYADIITYLPLDTRANARRFITTVQPELVIFVKYEFWYHHLSELAFRHIPLLLVSSIFRKDQVFFRWYGRFYKRMLFLFRQLFVQDEESLLLLQASGIPHARVGGDTRFDRVKKIAARQQDLTLIRQFTGESQVIVAGSTWEQDESVLASYAARHPVKMVIVPHEIREEHILELQQRFPACVRYSELKALNHSGEVRTGPVWQAIHDQEQIDLAARLSRARTLIVDGMGLLSRLYAYATITYVGGGFRSGIHNTLEAAVYSKPVIFGPNYGKFREAVDLIAEGGGFSIRNSDELSALLDRLLENAEELSKAGKAAGAYVEANTGATLRIVQFIQENRLLTN